MFKKKKPVPKNPITELLENKDVTDPEKIKMIFGQEEYVILLPQSIRSEIELLINFILKNIDDILNYILKEAEKEEEKEFKTKSFALISRNVTIALSSTSNKLREKLSRQKPKPDEDGKEDDIFEFSQLFQKRMIEFIDSDDANINTSNHWGKIMTSFVTNPDYTFFKDKFDEILPKLILNSEFPGYRDLIQSVATQNVNSDLFKFISEGIADNMREYRIYKKDLDKNKEILDKLYIRTFYLLKIITQSYSENTDLNLGSWKNKYEIVRNLLEALFAETDKKLVFDSCINVLCIIMDIVNKPNNDDKDDDDYNKIEHKDGDKNSFDEMIKEKIHDEMTPAQTIRKLVRATGKSFYSKLGLYDKDVKFTPEMTSKDLEKYDLVIRSFPIFWEAGINQLSPLLFHGCTIQSGKDKGVEYPEQCQDTITPSKVAKTITDKVCKWISILNETDRDLFNSTIDIKKEIKNSEKQHANRKLIKFIENNNIVENLMKYFPRDLLTKEGRIPFLNPFIIILAELLSVGFLKPRAEYNGTAGDTTITYSLTSLGETKIDEFPQSMQNEEFTRFIFEQVIPLSTEISKIET